jgi:uncharacterized membrane protein YraQ (UPF0718 family)
MDALIQLTLYSIDKVITSFVHNWPYLLVSVFVAVLLKLFLDPAKISAFLTRYEKAGVVGATLAAVGTPLCSCGTTAIVLGMMASMMPWAPIVAFMVASPLTSPEELIYSAGLFGWPFALTFFISSIVLGLLGGLLASIAESRGWLKNQTRFNAADQVGPRAASKKSSAQPICACETAPQPAPVLTLSTACCGAASAPIEPVSGCACSSSRPVVASSCTCSSESEEKPQTTSSCACNSETTQKTERPAVTWSIFWKEVFSTGQRLLVMFAGFAFIGYFLNGLIPSEWVAAIFGEGNIYSVPLAATIGLPLYINTEASLPLVKALIDGGMSQGAALAFMITGAGTSFGAVAGALTIARWRVVGLVVFTLWIGGILTGTLFNFLLASGIL